MTIQQNTRTGHSRASDDEASERGNAARKVANSAHNSNDNSYTSTPKPYSYGRSTLEGRAQKSSIFRKIHVREDALPALPAYPQRSKSGLGQVIQKKGR